MEVNGGTHVPLLAPLFLHPIISPSRSTFLSFLGTRASAATEIKILFLFCFEMRFDGNQKPSANVDGLEEGPSLKVKNKLSDSQADF